MTVEESSHKRNLVLILVVGVLTGCVHYYSKFDFSGIQNATSTTTYALVSDSDQVRDRIHAEALRQADENRRIRALPHPTWKDSAAVKAHLEAQDKLIDLQARSVFLSDFKAMPSVDVPVTGQGIIVGWSNCNCTVSPRSSQHLVKVRLKFRTSGHAVEGWICSDAMVMLHNLDL